MKLAQWSEQLGNVCVRNGVQTLTVWRKLWMMVKDSGSDHPWLFEVSNPKRPTRNKWICVKIVGKNNPGWWCAVVKPKGLQREWVKREKNVKRWIIVKDTFSMWIKIIYIPDYQDEITWSSRKASHFGCYESGIWLFISPLVVTGVWCVKTRDLDDVVLIRGCTWHINWEPWPGEIYNLSQPTQTKATLARSSTIVCSSSTA